MIRRIQDERFNLMEYIGDEYYKCLYLYLDYKQYGVNDNNVEVYVQEENGNIVAACLKYSSSLHIYSRELNCNYDELYSFIKENNYRAIFAEAQIIHKLENKSNNEYKSEYGNVWQVGNISDGDVSEVELANITDFEEIAKLIMTDEDIASSYDYDDLVKQLRDRYKDKFGRNYVMRYEDQIVSHICTNAETDNAAIVALLIVDAKYRRMGIATKMLRKIARDLSIEGKNAYLINYTENSTALYEKMGMKKCCEWGKLIRI